MLKEAPKLILDSALTGIESMISFTVKHERLAATSALATILILVGVAAQRSTHEDIRTQHNNQPQKPIELIIPFSNNRITIPSK